ncbi:MAG: 4a-hydroxytetrahydrobiopterin dehydratase [Bacteroidetes bacterium]|nr:4a-hydroxytetrahydrobiopterin dehydratase [Bacteroidota bacterium]
MAWTESAQKLERTFTFNNFIDAFSWMTSMAIEVEKMNHHPEWNNVYNKVHVQLTTHDAGNKVTQKDRDLAQKMDQHYTKFI